MDTALWDIVKILITSALSFGLGITTMMLTRRRNLADEAEAAQKKRDKDLTELQEANNLGTLALIRKALIDAYDNYVVHKCPMTVERRHEVDQLFKAYRKLGGNGTVAHLYEEVIRVDTEIVSLQDAKA